MGPPVVMTKTQHTARYTENYYSATTELWLDCGHLGCIPLSQSGSTFIIAVDAIGLPPCEAQVVVKVDGRVHRRAVKLANGLSKSNREAMILSSDGLCPF
jgi:hypothetical protein